MQNLRSLPCIKLMMNFKSETIHCELELALWRDQRYVVVELIKTQRQVFCCYVPLEDGGRQIAQPAQHAIQSVQL